MHLQVYIYMHTSIFMHICIRVYTYIGKGDRKRDSRLAFIPSPNLKSKGCRLALAGNFPDPFS